MLRNILRQLIYNSRSPVIRNISAKSSQRFFSHPAKLDPISNLAVEFENEGKAHTAEDIYKKRIDKDPYNKQAYQDLWDFWKRNCSLKVTQKELDEFRFNYEKYIGGAEKAKNSVPKLG